MSNTQNIISISGGKDSSALLLYAIEQQVPNLKAVFADTGNEHPLTYEYIHYLSDRINVPIQIIKADFSEELQRRRGYINSQWRQEGIPDEICNTIIDLLVPSSNPFFDMCLWKGLFPTPKRRFCTQELKLVPMYEQIFIPLLDSGQNVEAWLGIRAEESPSRAKQPKRELIGTFKNEAQHHNYRPLLTWSVGKVFEQHKRHNIKPNPLYSLGMGRVGCMPCIYCRKSELLQIAMRFPEQIEKIAQWEALISQVSKRGKTTFFPTNKGRGDGIWAWVEWSKTKRGSKEFDLFRMEETKQQCSSIYGLCE